MYKCSCRLVNLIWLHVLRLYKHQFPRTNLFKKLVNLIKHLVENDDSFILKILEL